MRQEYMDTLMEREGLGVEPSGKMECYACGVDGAVYQCDECSGGGLRCRNCIVTRHVESPLHRIRVSTLMSPCDDTYQNIVFSAGMDFISSH